MKKPIKIAVTGAGGKIGYSLIFRIISGGLLGQEQPVALQLVETPMARERLRALEHGNRRLRIAPSGGA